MKVPFHPLAADITPILDTALDAVVVMREDGVVAGWNAVAERIFGWSAEQAMGRQLSELIIPHALREAHHRGLAHFLETGEGPVLNRLIEVTGLRSDGAEIPVELSITPTISGQDRLFLGFLRDISERKAAEAVMERRTLEAEALSRLTSAASEGAEAEQVMRQCLEAVCSITGWKLGHAFYCSDDDPDLLVDSGVWHLPNPGDYAPLIERTREIGFRSGIGLPGAALQRREPVWLADVRQSIDFLREPVTREVGLQSAFAFPVMSGLKPLAILEFFHDDEVEPDRTLWPGFQLLGEQVGRVFDRSRAARLLRQEHESLLAEIERREALEQHQQLLLRELNHRVKNILSVVQGIAQQTFRSSDVPSELLTGFQSRLAALARAHDLMIAENWGTTSFDRAVEEALGPFSGSGEAIRLDADAGDEWLLSPQAAVTVALAVHELATNAVKYGALSVEGGQVTIRTHSDEEGFLFVWEESGGPPVAVPQRRGFGTRILEDALARELQAEVGLQFERSGLVCRIRLPQNRD